MFLRLATTIFDKLEQAAAGETSVSRRHVLAGLSATGALAFAGSILGAREAEAMTVPGSPAVHSDSDVVLVQRRRDDDDRDDDRSNGVSGHSYRRRDRDRDRGRNRMSRREIRYRCRNDRRFRRNNRRLCDIASGRGRGGECVQVGPVLLCE